MTKSRNQIRLDEIEINLTPKEWAMDLADRIRSYPTARDFMSATVQGASQQCPYVRPYYALAEQAEVRYPSEKPADLQARYQLDRKLRMEYHFLKMLIVNINDDLERRNETYHLRTCALTNQVHNLILRDATAHVSAKTVTSIGQPSVTENGDSEWELRVRDLTGLVLMAGSPVCLFSLAQDLADQAATLLQEIVVDKAAVQIVQDKRFDGHALLDPSIENSLNSTLETVRENVSIFNEYLNTKADFIRHDGEQVSPDSTMSAFEEKVNSLAVDVKRIEEEGKEHLAKLLATTWENRVQFKSTVDFLRETDQHREYIWEHFVKEFGVEA